MRRRSSSQDFNNFFSHCLTLVAAQCHFDVMQYVGLSEIRDVRFDTKVYVTCSGDPVPRQLNCCIKHSAAECPLCLELMLVQFVTPGSASHMMKCFVQMKLLVEGYATCTATIQVHAKYVEVRCCVWLVQLFSGNNYLK